MATILRGLYTRLPFGWAFRLRLKDWLFRKLGWLLRRTDAYRRWQAFGGGALPLAARKDPVNEPVLDRYVREMLAGNSAYMGVHYLPLRAETVPEAPLAAKAIAFYLPQFYPIAENDRWWGRGFTEWTNVSKAVPQFIGHYQPQLPGELGFYDLRLIEVMHRQVELAKLHGLHGFCFHHYWFSGQRLLERPLDQYLADASIDFPFCLCWANENWTRRWDGKDDDVLMGQVYGDDNDEAFIRDLLPYLRDHRYIRIDGRPLLVVYRPSLLPDCRRTLEHWRRYCREQGLGEIFLAMVQFDLLDPRECGFDAAVEFPPHKLAEGMPSINYRLEIINPDYRGYVIDYPSLVQRAKNWPKPDYPLFRGVFPGWDNEARKPGQGYTFANSTPESYRGWLASAVGYAKTHPVAGESIVFINAWNEWAEGAHLEPDRKYGYAYLQATRTALTRASSPGKILLVVHDAHPHGAQYLALHLLREMTSELRLEVEVLMLGPGSLLPEFSAIAKIHTLFDASEASIQALAIQLCAEGVGMVLANTTVAGRVVRPFKNAGLRVVTLIHELPGVIRQYRLERAVVDLVEGSDCVVVPTDGVRQGLEQFLLPGQLGSKVQKLPQGLYIRSKYRGIVDKANARRLLRNKLAIEFDARIVLAVGYADHRKGLDLLVEACLLAAKGDSRLHLVWVGNQHLADLEQAIAAIARAGMQSRFHFVGHDFATADYYAGADLYALASREDPFPSVVLESLSVGTPVVAFAGTGGGADLLARGGGVTVPAFDVAAYAAAISGLLGDDIRRAELGRSGCEMVDSEFSFRSYVIDLLNLGGCALPRVSVVVPNYNYARYLEERLQSIAAQSLPAYEIIVLDDASSDDSRERLQALRPLLNPEPRIIVNETNSGSLFRQWLRGVELARGDYVWIAEADDLAKPDFLMHIVSVMQDDPSIVIGYCQSTPIDERGRVMANDYKQWTDDLSRQRWCSSYVASGAGEVTAGLSVKNTIPNVSAAVFRRDALLAVLRANIEEIASYRIAGDWVVYLRLLQHGRIFYDPAPGNLHRRHAASAVSALDASEHFREVLNAQRLAAKLYPLDPEALASAGRYAERLRRKFGLAVGE